MQELIETPFLTNRSLTRTVDNAQPGKLAGHSKILTCPELPNLLL